MIRKWWLAVGTLALFGLGARVEGQTFGFTGTIVTWAAPTTSSYFITAIGAQGGYGPQDLSGKRGGRGALMGGLFSFTAGDLLLVAVGQMGSQYAGNVNGGGGGGSFIVDWSGNPLLIAGGGGGVRSYAFTNGSDASTTPFAKNGSCNAGSDPGTTKTTDLGQGGNAPCSSYGDAGAGFYSNGAIDASVIGDVTAAQDWANGLAGGNGAWRGAESFCDSYGGFGGGGSGTGCGGGGGGGGYSGGDGGYVAGGGGSWNVGGNQIAVAGVGYGDGSIEIDQVTTPEPASVLMLGTGLLGFGIVVRRGRTA